MTAIPKRPRPKDPEHLAFIASLVCAVCGAPNPVPHHLLRGVVRGMGMRAGDQWVVPLCPEHHRELHAGGNETEFFIRYGIDPQALAYALYDCTGDADAGLTMIQMYRRRA